MTVPGKLGLLVTLVENHWSKLSCSTVLEWYIFNFWKVKTHQFHAVIGHLSNYTQAALLTSMTPSCYVLVFRFVRLPLTWVPYKSVACKWQRKRLNHYSRSARPNRAVKPPHPEVAWRAAFPNAVQWAFTFYFPSKYWQYILTYSYLLLIYVSYPGMSLQFLLLSEETRNTFLNGKIPM